MSDAAGETTRKTVSSERHAESPKDPSAIAGRFSAALSLERDKPDTNLFTDLLGSPVSPLRPRGASAALTSSSSSSSGSASSRMAPHGGSAAGAAAAAGGGRRNTSGELSDSSGSSPVAVDRQGPRPDHRRSGSGSLMSTGSGSASGSSSSASSPANNAYPAGNIFPSGKVVTTGMMTRTVRRTDVLGSGSGNYGIGNVVRSGMGLSDSSPKAAGGLPSKKAMGTNPQSPDPQEMTRAGNEHYKKGQFAEALRFYDRAVAMCPANASCRSNRAAALMGLGRLQEAAKECEEALRLDPANGRAHHRLACINVRLGQVELARKHLNLTGQQPDPVELLKLQTVERHLARITSARKIGDWKSALREADAAIAAGADSSLMLIISRAESLLRLHQLGEADVVLSSSLKYENSSPSTIPVKFFGMLPESYFYITRAEIDLALGRFDNAISTAEKARRIDYTNREVMKAADNVKAVVKARAQGNELYNAGNFAEACAAYAEGLKYDPSNAVLLCNRAACRSFLGQLERSIEDCNEALRIQPNYTKALRRRADSNFKLQRWAEAVRDFQVLRKEFPSDTELAENLFHAELALKASRGEEVSNMRFGGEVEDVTSVEQFQAATSLPGTSIMYFMTASDQRCNQLSPFVDSLCVKYPSVNFLKVDVNQSPAIAQAQDIRVVPTFKIYRNKLKVKEIISPSYHVLEQSLRYYSI